MEYVYRQGKHVMCLCVCVGGEGYMGEVLYMRAVKYRKMQKSCSRIHGAEYNDVG